MAKIDEHIKVMMLKGETGANIKSIDKTATNGMVDTYTVTLTDGTTSEFTVRNGKDGADFDTFEIGGRNLIPGSKDFSGTVRMAPEATYSTETVGGSRCTVLSLDNTAGAGDIDLVEWSLQGVGTAGAVYTASFWFKGIGSCGLYFHGGEGYTPVARSIMTVNGTVEQFENRDGSVSFIPTGIVVSDWTRCTVVYTLSDTPGSTTEKRLLWRAYSGTKISIALPKLERSTKPSDWTPAPEDKADEADLQSLSAKVTANTTGISKNTNDISTLQAVSVLYSANNWRVCVKCGFVWVYAWEVKTGSGSWDSTTCPYVLPEEYRPSIAGIVAPAATNNGASTTGSLEVNSNGEIIVSNRGSSGSEDNRYGVLCYPIGI